MFKINSNPIELGNLEVGWWKAHNEHSKLKLLQFLVEQNIKLYSFTKKEAEEAIKHLIGAVKFHDVKDWGKAIEAIVPYYQKVKNKTGLNFDPRKISELEVAWWRLHDDLEYNLDKSRLAEAFSRLYSTEFDIEFEKMKRAGEYKARATYEHDLAENPETPKEKVTDHWKNCENLLREFYSELFRVIETKN